MLICCIINTYPCDTRDTNDTNDTNNTNNPIKMDDASRSLLIYKYEHGDDDDDSDCEEIDLAPVSRNPRRVQSADAVHDDLDDTRGFDVIRKLKARLADKPRLCAQIIEVIFAAHAEHTEYLLDVGGKDAGYSAMMKPHARKLFEIAGNAAMLPGGWLDMDLAADLEGELFEVYRDRVGIWWHIDDFKPIGALMGYKSISDHGIIICRVDVVAGADVFAALA